MSDSNGTGSDRPPRRRGRQALFSVDAPSSADEPTEPIEASGRRALFSSTAPAAAAGEVNRPAAGRGTAVVHCRTCLAATPVSLPSLGRALIPSLWLPTRPWPRLMRCPACHRTSWCRIDWPSLR